MWLQIPHVLCKKKKKKEKTVKISWKFLTCLLPKINNLEILEKKNTLSKKKHYKSNINRVRL